MSLYLGKNVYKKIFATFLCASFACQVAFADSCKNRVFNIKISDTVSIGEVLNQLSDVCDFSIVKKDEYAKNVLDESISGINIKDLTLKEIFSVLLTKNNLSYEYNKNLLQISSTTTRTFKVDYITSIREGKSITKASVDAAPTDISSGSSNSESVDKQDNIIETKEKFDFWEKLNIELQAVLNNGSEKLVAPEPIINPSAGLVTVTGTNSQIQRVASYLENLKRSLKKQVMLDVSIISINLNNAFTRGIDWSKFQLGFNSYLGNDPTTPTSFLFGRKDPAGTGYYQGQMTAGTNLTTTGTGGTVTGSQQVPGTLVPAAPSMKGINGGFIVGGGVSFDLDGVLNFLETKGKTKVVSSPKIMTMNNQQALISVGDNVNYQIIDSQSDFGTDSTSVEVTQYTIFIGVLLNILPQISDNGKIMLRINPSLSTFKWQEDNMRTLEPRKIAPDTLQKKLSTVVEVNSGDTIVLGGLISEEKGRNINKVPVLGDIPFLGYLFKSSQDILNTTELVFIITPKLVGSDDSKPVKESLKDLGFFGIMYE